MKKEKSTEMFEGRSPLQDELEQWMFQQTRGHLRNLFNVLERHRNYLNENALKFVSSNVMDKARLARAKAEDMDKIINLIQERIKECAKEVNKGGR